MVAEEGQPRAGEETVRDGECVLLGRVRVRCGLNNNDGPRVETLAA